MKPRRRPRLRRLAVAAAAVLLVAAAGAQHEAAPLASVQELMQAFIDPSADALWEAVSSEVTAEGTVEQQPRNDEEWHALRLHALRLAEGARLLGERGRAVAAPGRVLEDAHVAGILSAPQIQQAIERDPAAFAQRAAALQGSARDALAAIDARDVQRLLRVGQAIDHACESCHQAYWYPNDRRPGEWPARLEPGKK